MEVKSLQYILIMKVGFHTDETLEDIVSRKKKENLHGPFFWGYGGTVCHPKNQVQLFAEEAQARGQKVYLLMSFTPSKFTASPTVSSHYSADNVTWKPVPDYALITGSKYALVCRGIYEVNVEINLSEYVVGVGPNKGIRVPDYLRKRVDKACAIHKPLGDVQDTQERLLKIQYVSELVEPYAVFLRGDKPDEAVQRQLHLFR